MFRSAASGRRTRRSMHSAASMVDDSVGAHLALLAAALRSGMQRRRGTVPRGSLARPRKEAQRWPLRTHGEAVSSAKPGRRRGPLEGAPVPVPWPLTSACAATATRCEALGRPPPDRARTPASRRRRRGRP
jgi:hypothetical protein